MTRGRFHLAVGLFVGAALCTAAVDAKPKKPSRAARRFEKKGKKAYAKKRFDDAVAAFKLAYEADPHPRFLFNTARSYDKKGDLEAALEFLVRYVEEETDPEERADGQAELEILEQRLKESHAPLDLTATPEGAMVVIRGGGRELTMSVPVSRWLKAGSWQITVSAPGHDSWERRIVVEAGAPKRFEVELREEAAAAPPPAEEPKPRTPKPKPAESPPPAAAAEAPGGEGGGSLVPWLAMGAGGALLAGGAAFAVLAGQSQDARDALKGTGAFYDDVQAKQDEAEGRALVGNVLLGAGAVAAGTGLVLLLLGGDEAGEARSGAVRTRSRAGGLVLEGTF